MMDGAAVEAMISQYLRHGWALRRVLLSDALRRQIGDERGGLFGDAELFFSDLDALWFSRSSRPGAETWELRQLGNSPYALDAFLDSEMEAAAREEILLNTENRLREVQSGRTGN